MTAIDHAIYNIGQLIAAMLTNDIDPAEEHYSRADRLEHAKRNLAELHGYLDARDGTNTAPVFYRPTYEEAYTLGCNLLKVKGE